MSLLIEIIDTLEIPVIYYSLITLVFSGIAIHFINNILGFVIIFISLIGIGIAISIYPDWVLYFSIFIVVATAKLNQKYKVNTWKI